MPEAAPPPFVAEAGFNRWVVERSRGLRGPLRRLGFRRLPFAQTATFASRRALSFEEMGRMAMALRDLGIAFSAGRNWCPSAVVAQLRDDGLAQGEFTEIAWTGEGWLLRKI